MRADEAVMKQLAARLKRLRRRIDETAAEIVMVEQMMADVERRAVNPRLKLRRNSVSKLSIQSAIRSLLLGKSAPTRAKDIFEYLKKNYPDLNSSTFRSHIKRMVESGSLGRDSRRGHYRLTKTDDLDDREPNQPVRRREIIEWSYK